MEDSQSTRHTLPLRVNHETIGYQVEQIYSTNDNVRSLGIHHTFILINIVSVSLTVNLTLSRSQVNTHHYIDVTDLQRVFSYGIRR